MTKAKELKNIKIINTKGKIEEIKEAYLLETGELFQIWKQAPCYIFTEIKEYQRIITDTGETPFQWAIEHNGERVVDAYKLNELNIDLYEITENIDLALEY